MFFFFPFHFLLYYAAYGPVKMPTAWWISTGLAVKSPTLRRRLTGIFSHTRTVAWRHLELRRRDGSRCFVAFLSFFSWTLQNVWPLLALQWLPASRSWWEIRPSEGGRDKYLPSGSTGRWLDGAHTKSKDQPINGIDSRSTFPSGGKWFL